MENQKNDNLNMLEAIVQNTEMGKNTLDQLVPMAEDEQFKAELLRQRNIYRQLNQEAHAAIDACGGSAQGQSAMAKLNTKVSIGMKTITDKSTRNLAEMLTQGSGMGVVDCIKSQKDYPAERVVCRLSDTLFAIGCADRTRRELEEELKAIYAEMPKECVASVGLMRRVPFTQSIGVAGTREVRCKNWDALYDLCEKRLAAAQTAGGDRIYDGE